MHRQSSRSYKAEETNSRYPTHLLSTRPCNLTDTLYLLVGSKKSTRLRAIHSTYDPTLLSVGILDAYLHSPRKVDTKAIPPRSIWKHPYEDEEYLKAHPDVREKINISGSGGSESNLHPPSFEESQRRHSFGGAPSSSRPQSTSTPAAKLTKRRDRGLLGKLKDKAIGTKEEREAEKRRRQEEVIRYVTGQLRFEANRWFFAQDRVRMEAQRQRIQQTMMARQQLYGNQPQYGHGPMPGGSRFGGGYGSYGSNRRRQGGGMGGMGLPILGGLAGGLLLGEALDGGFGDGGFGGGDFGGGDFGGGDFGGGF